MPPSKREILEKYKHVITHEDFELLVADHLPSPEVSHREGIALQLLGCLNGWYVVAKRCGMRIVGVIVLLGGGFIPGIQYVNQAYWIAYDEVTNYLARANDHPDVPATEYVVAGPPPQWALHNEEPFRLFTTATTTTTTTTPEPEEDTSLPSGTGLIPYSSKWDELA